MYSDNTVQLNKQICAVIDDKHTCRKQTMGLVWGKRCVSNTICFGQYSHKIQLRLVWIAACDGDWNGIENSDPPCGMPVLGSVFSTYVGVTIIYTYEGEMLLEHTVVFALKN